MTQAAMTIAEVDRALAACDRLIAAKRGTAKPKKPARKSDSNLVHGRAAASGRRLPETKKPLPPRKLFVYAKDLRVGDETEVHGSFPIPGSSGAWADTVERGVIMAMTRDTLYSKVVIILSESDWASEHRIPEMQYMPLLNAREV